MTSIKVCNIKKKAASVRCYYKFELASISSNFYKWRIDFYMSRLSQAPPFIGVYWTSTCKNMFLPLSLQKAVSSHTCTVMRPSTPFFFGLLFDLLWSCCLCPYGNVTNKRAIPFHYDSPSRVFPPCCFLFVLGSRLMPTFQRSTPHRVQKLNLL